MQRMDFEGAQQCAPVCAVGAQTFNGAVDQVAGRDIINIHIHGLSSPTGGSLAAQTAFFLLISHMSATAAAARSKLGE